MAVNSSLIHAIACLSLRGRRKHESYYTWMPLLGCQVTAGTVAPNSDQLCAGTSQGMRLSFPVKTCVDQ
eukprot:3460522-Amphidinium_carterae.1